MGIGAWKDYTLGIKGEDLNGVTQGIKFLSAVADSPDKKVPIGKRAAVVGGGNSAIDCVRTLLRLGCEEVYIVYRRTRKEMPANEVEIVASEHEGIKFQFLAAPTRVIDDGQGNVAGLEYLQMELGEPDASGRRRPVPVEGSETVLDVDMVISAISQQPDVSFMETNRTKTILPSPAGIPLTTIPKFCSAACRTCSPPAMWPPARRWWSTPSAPDVVRPVLSTST
jgi:formate dehydrogenase beta subunit